MTVALRSKTPGAARALVDHLDGRRIVRVDVDSTERLGALSSTTSETIAVAAETARDLRLPFIAALASSGADITEGFSSLHGWGRAARAFTSCSGIVPTIVIVDGAAVSGPALLLGIADFVIMTQRSYAFVSGPTMVAEFTGVAIDNDELGGATAHARFAGTASFVVADVDEAWAVAAQLLAYLPDNVDVLPERWPTDDPWDRPTPEAGALLPATSTGSYDIRAVMRSLADDGELLEIKPRWAANMVTAFATFEGRPVGILGNQPTALAGTLDIPASQKAARFVAFCDAFNLALITLVDTPGFYPGKDLEWRGMIRHGAQLVVAYARASVPRIGIILRKSYGGAYIVMDSKKMGNDVCLAWPGAELAVMGAGQAAAILQRRATPDERAAFEADYSARLLNPYIAAERGYVDGVIDPAETRIEICRSLRVLAHKREHLPSRKHDNGPC